NIQILHKTLHLLVQTLPMLFYGFRFAIIVTSLMKIERNAMKKIFFTFLIFIITLSTVSAQKGINFNHNYAAGGRLLMNVDSSAINVHYANIFPNQPNTYFSYLPEVDSVSIQIYFRK